MMPGSVPERRYAVFAEGRFLDDNAKTAHGLLRYGKDEVVAIVDSTLAGGNVLDVMPGLHRDAPIVGTVGEALGMDPTSMLVGLAPAGGNSPPNGWTRCGKPRMRALR